MAKYHISKDGMARKCQAKSIGSCRAVKSGFDEHFETREEAQASFEKSMSNRTVSTLKKKKKSLSNVDSYNGDELLKPIVIKKTADVKQFYDMLDEVNTGDSYYEKMYSLNDFDKQFIKDFANGEIPESVPVSMQMGRSAFVVHGLAQDAGYFAKITKQFAHGLTNKIKKDLGDKEPVVLDPLAGKGYFVKAMREQGVKTIGSDDKSWSKVQTDDGIENSGALESLDKHGDEITHLVMSWAPMNDLDKKLYDRVREKFPHVTIVNIGEGPGGCTGSEKFWNKIDKDEDNELIEIEYDNCGYQNTHGLNDYVTFVKPVEE